MPTYLITHNVDDVAHWWNSPQREQLFGPMGITVRTFRNAAGGPSTALLAEIPDLDAFMAVLQTPEGAAAAAHDGVHLDSIVLYEETAP
ncbi:MAG TPA: hypothetical protein VL422_04670 [Miltoncostaea sp.]|jgi:hypothetical protein|nr:hypothetical protein [Miltoncostaea sp.]